MRWMLMLYSIFIIFAAAICSLFILRFNFRHPFRLILIILIIAALPLLISYFAINYYTPLSETKVPDLLGLTESEAKASLSEAGLTFKVEMRYEDSDTVTFQRPEAGKTVKEGRLVSVIIGKPKIGELPILTQPLPIEDQLITGEEIIEIEETTDEGAVE